MPSAAGARCAAWATGVALLLRSRAGVCGVCGLHGVLQRTLLRPSFCFCGVWSTYMAVSWRRHSGVCRQRLSWVLASVAVVASLAAVVRCLTCTTMEVGLVMPAVFFHCVVMMRVKNYPSWDNIDGAIGIISFLKAMSSPDAEYAVDREFPNSRSSPAAPFSSFLSPLHFSGGGTHGRAWPSRA